MQDILWAARLRGLIILMGKGTGQGAAGSNNTVH